MGKPVVWATMGYHGVPWGTHGYPDAGPKAPASPARAPPSPVPAAPTLPVMQVSSTQAAAQLHLVPEGLPIWNVISWDFVRFCYETTIDQHTPWFF